MARPPRRAVARKSGLLNPAAVVAVVEELSDSDGDGRPGPDIQQGLAQEFGEALKAQKDALGLDDEQLRRLSEHFESALTQLGEEDLTEPVTIDDLKSSLMETARVASASMDAGESGELHRQIAAVASSLERRESRIAIEFSRRLQSDGKDRALLWLEEQIKAGASEAEEAEEGSRLLREQARKAVSGTDTVRSRSRRLRGPPRVG